MTLSKRDYNDMEKKKEILKFYITKFFKDKFDSTFLYEHAFSRSKSIFLYSFWPVSLSIFCL